MTGIASENSNRASDERFPVLLVEDADIISGAVVDMAPFIHPSLDFIIARNRDEVAQVLLDRGDIHVVFLDYNLDNGTNTKGLPKYITLTQRNVIDIIATSGCPETRAIQMTRDKATKSCDKSEIFKELQGIVKKHILPRSNGIH